MKRLVYAPQKDITSYELALVLKVFTIGCLPSSLKTNEVLFSIYDSLPPEAQRHFKIKENEDNR